MGSHAKASPQGNTSMNVVTASHLRDSISQGFSLTPHALFPSQDGGRGGGNNPKGVERTVYTLLPPTQQGLMEYSLLPLHNTKKNRHLQLYTRIQAQTDSFNSSK